ncbi:MAG: amidase, partial [Gammaproteobacteria bacterium]|nr:amidase [Gammaproteobacteria bacterium]
WPTRRGSRAVDPEQAWEDDAPATARLKEHGAVILGKTTTPEFGWKGVTDSRLTGITRNPWNTTMTPGGSSGGAAAACALGMGALHIGTDGGGSIRIPAGFTGIFGLKPSFGRVPAWPLSPFGTVAHVGPMTRTVADAALMLTVLAQPDARDWYSLPVDDRDYRTDLDAGVEGLRVAFSADLGCADIDPNVAQVVRDAVSVFTDAGARVEEVAAPFASPAATFRTFWYAGAATLLGRFTAAQRALIESGLQAIATEGDTYSLSDYLNAVRQRAELGQTMKEFHARYDLLLTPTLPIPAFTAGHEILSPPAQKGWVDWTPFTYPFNLTQQPACSVPCGFTSTGLPVGLQIVGPMFDDALVLRAARAFETQRPFVMPQAPAV